jgi:hypothetical protein
VGCRKASLQQRDELLLAQRDALLTGESPSPKTSGLECTLLAIKVAPERSSAHVRLSLSKRLGSRKRSCRRTTPRRRFWQRAATPWPSQDVHGLFDLALNKPRGAPREAASSSPHKQDRVRCGKLAAVNLHF